ncbi:hypothetical protein BGZ99_008822 [Dissophora globulifera]|uniref:Methionyl-tRNA formyltransferase, mitochondrial n=1 Tax=Dissophora globulifera TaxID=979702 RepID=A0A9P6RVT7_9FUNG|nr:hypothetical protein BGZ99_008822 [Dissophora globulifera]
MSRLVTLSCTLARRPLSLLTPHIKARPFSLSTRLYKESDKVKILFFGSDSFSVPHLEALIAEKEKPGSIIERIDVVSPKERSNKSKRDAEDSPLTLLAKAHKLRTFPSPDRKGGFETWSFPEDEHVDAWDFGVVVSFGWFLPNDVITRFKKAGINVHPSLLPKYRGSAPLQRAILNQDKTAGVTVQLLDPNEFDAGKILAQAEVLMPENATYRSLESLLSKKGGEMVVDVINNYDERRRDAKVQDPAKVTKANKISRDACKVQWTTWDAAKAERLHRATGFRYPITTVWSAKDSEKSLSIALYELFCVDNQQSHEPTSGYAAEDGVAPTKDSPPGTIFYHRPTEALHVTCSDGSLLGVRSVQFEGKKRVVAKDFYNGYHIKSGISRFK